MLRGPSLRSTNNALLLCIVAVNLYIITLPVVPQVTYWWQAHHTARHSQLTRLVDHPVRTPAASQPNGIIVPAMLLQQPIIEGPESNWSNLLRSGIWRWPDSSTPDKGGNTVFLAHRFSYTGPHGAFYYLDKLRPGDEMSVIWNNQTYTYIVASTTEVSPSNTAIENNTPGAQITLFTCTPLWHPVNRLVVVAKQKGQPS